MPVNLQRILSSIFRWAANLWSLSIIILMGIWILVHFDLFPMKSKWIVLGYCPPIWFILFIVPPLAVYLIQNFKRRSRTLVVLYLLFFGILGDISFFGRSPHQFSSQQKTQSLSVVALNLRYYSYGFDKVITAINDLNADIYLLSENSIKPGKVKELKKKVYPRKFYMGQMEGTAIISRYPVISFREIKFPTRQASLHIGNKIEEMHLNPFRSFVHAVVDVNGVPVHAISVRFIAGRSWDKRPQSVIPWTFYVLGEQIKEISFFQEYIKGLEGPVIFGGDLNATPSSIVLNKLNEVAVDVYLQDHVWGGFTFWSRFPSFARLDYIFCMNETQAVKSEMPDIVVSDHYPVYAEILIPAKR